MPCFREEWARVGRRRRKLIECFDLATLVNRLGPMLLAVVLAGCSTPQTTPPIGLQPEFDLASHAAVMSWETGLGAEWMAWHLETSQPVAVDFSLQEAAGSDLLLLAMINSKETWTDVEPIWVLEGDATIERPPTSVELAAGDQLWLIVVNPQDFPIDLVIAASGRERAPVLPASRGVPVFSEALDPRLDVQGNTTWVSDASLQTPEALAVVGYSIADNSGDSTLGHAGRFSTAFPDGSAPSAWISQPTDLEGGSRQTPVAFARFCQPAGEARAEHRYLAAQATSVAGLMLLESVGSIERCS